MCLDAPSPKVVAQVVDDHKVTSNTLTFLEAPGVGTQPKITLTTHVVNCVVTI